MPRNRVPIFIEESSVGDFEARAWRVATRASGETPS
jgi:hypothetical protein